MITYRSLNLKNSLSPVLSKLCNGSVQSAIELFLQDKTSHIRNQALAGITRVVHRECSKLSKKSLLKTRPADLSSFQFNNLQDEFEREIQYQQHGIFFAEWQQTNKKSVIKLKLLLHCSIVCLCVYTTTSYKRKDL